jgi:16S rRNA processing protein RimM
MITRDNCQLLGTIAKPHGTKGSVLLWLRNIKAEEFIKRESVFVEIDGLLVPFFIEEFKKSSSDAVIMKFEDVDSETKARTIAGLEVYIEINQVRLKKEASDRIPLLTGYRVQDINLGFIGTAGEIEDIAHNPLLHVRGEGKDFLIPVHADIILDINDKDKVITIAAPEGLFDL